MQNNKINRKTTEIKAIKLKKEIIKNTKQETFLKFPLGL
jgi:hypothetical protein